MLENTERQINPHPNVTIRQARNALHILVTGAAHAIAQSAPEGEAAALFAHNLLKQLREELDGWEAQP